MRGPQAGAEAERTTGRSRGRYSSWNRELLWRARGVRDGVGIRSGPIVRSQTRELEPGCRERLERSETKPGASGAGAGSRGCSWQSWSWGRPNDGVGSRRQELEAQEHGVGAWPHPFLMSPASQGVEWKGGGERKGGRAGAIWNEVPFAGSYRPRLKSMSGPEAGIGQELKGEAGGGWEGSRGLPVAEDVGVGSPKP